MAAQAAQLRAEFELELERIAKRQRTRLHAVQRCAEQHVAGLARQYQHYPMASMVALSHLVVDDDQTAACNAAAAVTKLAASTIKKELNRASTAIAENKPSPYVRPAPKYVGSTSKNLLKLQDPDADLFHSNLEI